jgi:cyclopropane-fatty-acyl-phospholipid synthase
MLGLLFSQVIKQGTLTVVWPSGKTVSYGAGSPRATIKVHGTWTPWTIGFRPDLVFGEAYMDGKVTVEHGTIADVLAIMLMNLNAGRLPGILRASRTLRQWLRSVAQFNSARRARRNVARHYDLSASLYALFLDQDLNYSCAYFQHPGASLEAAQIAKKNHIAAKLALERPNMKVLDIGSGWGSLGLDLARETNADVTGITLSTEQWKVATERAVAAGLADKCRFELKDYRAVEGQFDRIVSVGMFEHVGINYFDIFFAKLRDLLAPDGVALLHTIGRADGPGATSPWTSKYIFPGGYAPALSEIMSAVERCGLYVTDIEVWRLHYAETLKEWRVRFEKNRVSAAALYDERFCRMWEFYLAGAEMAFRYDRQVVFQIQLAKRIGTLPLTRDYMSDAAVNPRRVPRSHQSRREEAGIGLRGETQLGTGLGLTAADFVL